MAIGFVATDACVAVPGLGGMGYHYVKPSRIDMTFNVREPEVLVYPGRTGTVRAQGSRCDVVVHLEERHEPDGDACRDGVFRRPARVYRLLDRTGSTRGRVGGVARGGPS